MKFSNIEVENVFMMTFVAISLTANLLDRNVRNRSECGILHSKGKVNQSLT